MLLEKFITIQLVGWVPLGADRASSYTHYSWLHLFTNLLHHPMLDMNMHQITSLATSLNFYLFSWKGKLLHHFITLWTWITIFAPFNWCWTVLYVLRSIHQCFYPTLYMYMLNLLVNSFKTFCFRIEIMIMWCANLFSICPNFAFIYFLNSFHHLTIFHFPHFVFSLWILLVTLLVEFC